MRPYGRETDEVPLALLTGFLGAGKTTLLNRLLAKPAMAGSAVLINEVGAVGLDHLLVERVDGDLLMLTTGCICCAARGDLVTALESLLGRRDAGRIAFDRIVVETTGIADPRPIVEALIDHPVLRDRCRLAAILCVVDARDGDLVLAARTEARRQVAIADVLVASKQDLVGDGQSSAALRAARVINPVAPVIDARDAAAVIASLDAPREHGLADFALLPSHEPHHAVAAHHHAGIDTATLRAGVLDPRQFDTWIAAALGRAGLGLLRLKGLVSASDDPSRPFLVQAVGARLHEVTRLRAWPDADRSTRLVVIGEPGAVAAIETTWEDFFGPPAIDRPDAAALIGASAGPGLF